MPIAAIEVVRDPPAARRRGEPVGALIEDPWRRFECPPDPGGLRGRASRTRSFAASGRDAVYYVRALQEPTPAINGANLRTRFDADGNAVARRSPATRRRAHAGGRRLPRARAGARLVVADLRRSPRDER